MKNILVKPVSCLVGLTTLTVVSSTMPASAQTLSLDSSVEIGKYEDNSAQIVEAAVTSDSNSEPLAKEEVVEQKSEDFWFRRNASLFHNPSTVNNETFVYQEEEINNNPSTSEKQKPLVAPIPQEVVEQYNLPPIESTSVKKYQINYPELAVVELTPGTLDKSAAVLMVEPETAAVPEITSEASNTTIAQRDFDLRRIPRPIPNWIGIGGNIGLSDNDEDSALARGAFVVNAKLNLVRNISLRPAVIIADNTTFLVSATYDFLIPADQPFERIRFAPFVGGGAAFSTGDNSSVGFLLTGGVEVPISRQFVANGSISVGFLETTDVGIQLGVGYLFSEFLR
ncbi:MAG: hypothetical protein F6K31_14905 [Symploca sp. SIO2G7]|nr:hypothetical protein [Symploca sp. SIO2G7]